MKYSRILIGFAVAAIIFVGLFYALQTRYNLFVSLQNPFDEKVEPQSVEIAEDGEEKIFQSPEGELIIAYPGSRLEVSEENRELQEGALFASGALISLDILSEYLLQSVFLKNDRTLSRDDPNAGLPAIGSPEWIEMILNESSAGPEITGFDLLGKLEEGVPEEENSLEFISRGAFTFQDKTYKPGQIKVGKVLVNYPYSAVYIERSTEQGITTIYALGGGVEIYYEGAIEPFVIPSLHKVTLRDSLISSKTAQLYYTKLQKDFRLEPFSMIVPQIGDAGLEQEHPKDRIAAGWLIQEEWRSDMKDYAFSAHPILVSSTRQTVLKPFLDFLHKQQKKFALGYPKKKEDQEYYEATLQPLVTFIRDIGSGKKDPENIDAELSGLFAAVHSSRWGRVMSQYENYESSWRSFYVSHQAAIRRLSLNHNYYPFFNYWGDLALVNSFDKVQKLFLEAQLLNVLGEKYPSKSYFERVGESLQRKKVPKSARTELTNMRRGLINMIQSSSFFQTEELFDLLQYFAKSEVELYKDEAEISREIRLEIARDCLAFLNEFVEKRTNVEESNISLEIYKSMNVEKIQEELNRNIFSEREMEMIEFIDLLGTSRISPEEIERIKETIRIQEELRRIDEELAGLEIDETPVVVEDPDIIKNAMHLRSFFEEYELDTYKLIITNSSEDILSFKRLYYNKYSITGTFNLVQQRFDSIRTDVLQRESIRRSKFDTILKEMDRIDEQKIRDEENNANTQVDPLANISQNDRLSLSYRQRVVNLLRFNKVQTSLNNVLVANEERSDFQVRGASVNYGDGKTATISFAFNINTEQLSEVTLGEGDKAEVLPGRVKASDISSFLEAEMDRD